MMSAGLDLELFGPIVPRHTIGKPGPAVKMLLSQARERHAYAVESFLHKNVATCNQYRPGEYVPTRPSQLYFARRPRVPTVLLTGALHVSRRVLRIPMDFMQECVRHDTQCVARDTGGQVSSRHDALPFR